MSEDKETGLATSIPHNVSIYNADDANHMFMLAKQFSQSSLVPKHFQKKPEDCFLGKPPACLTSVYSSIRSGCKE